MAVFKLPNFHLLCNIFTKPFVVGHAPRLASSCQLRLFKTAFLSSAASSAATAIMYLGLPKLTDIRGSVSSTASDTVEVPAGSGRFYVVLAVDDVAKGLPNEYRAAALSQSSLSKTPLP